MGRGTAGGLKGHVAPQSSSGAPGRAVQRWSLPLFYRWGKRSWIGSHLAPVAEPARARGRADPRPPRPVRLSVAMPAGLG